MLCPTFGRAPRYLHLLNECVQSFVLQTYPHKEMVILNDCPQQTLVCDVPGVVIINAEKRYGTLGAKLNAIVEAASGDLLMPADDDDIWLPHRISQGVEAIGEHDYWNPQRTWYVPMDQYGRPNPIWDHNHGICHNASIFRKSAWEKVGGYPDISGPQDAMMDQRLKTLSVAPVGELKPKDWQYLYRWSVSPCHLSGMGATDEAYTEWGKRPVTQGEFRITPSWRMDYEAMVSTASPAK